MNSLKLSFYEALDVLDREDDFERNSFSIFCLTLGHYLTKYHYNRKMKNLLKRCDIETLYILLECSLYHKNVGLSIKICELITSFTTFDINIYDVLKVLTGHTTVIIYDKKWEILTSCSCKDYFFKYYSQPQPRLKKGIRYDMINVVSIFINKKLRRKSIVETKRNNITETLRNIINHNYPDLYCLNNVRTIPEFKPIMKKKLKCD